MFDSKAFLATVTTKPGVYRMLDTHGDVLYVGKAINLKKRLASYFNHQVKSTKTVAMVKQIAAIEVSVTTSEVEALLLESNLIKRFRPKYNVLLRDDKTYPYLYVNREHSYPRMDMIRAKKKPSSGDYYGPYTSSYAVRDALNTIQKLFKIRNCRESFFNSRSRPCLQYQIKRCTAPCVGLITPEAYRESVNDAIQFLLGDSKVLLAKLIERMDKAVDALAFEEAALIRDQIKALRAVSEQQGMTKQKGNVDILAIDAKDGIACICLVSVREGAVLSHETYFPSLPETSDNEAIWSEVCLAFMQFYYFDNPAAIPECIVLNHPFEEQSLVENTLTQLKSKKVVIQTTARGAKKRWLSFALDNLAQAMSHNALSRETMRARYEALQTLLALDTPITRMECFDISHTSGEATTASCVVFDKHGPLKRAYRQFNITNITPGDDYAAMEQALMRRFSALKKAQNFPSLLIIDGGLNQVAVAKRVLAELKIDEVPVLGLAKGPDRKAGFERLIWGEPVKEMTLNMDSPALHLLQYIRDESHRFAITKHRQRRDKARMTSPLEIIEGIGPKRRQALLKQFGGYKDLEKASLEEIAKVPGISPKLAKKIHDQLQPK